MAGSTDFRYLNLDLQWPGFALAHLEVGPDGRLTLARVPLALGQLGDGPIAGPIDPPAGLAVTPDCDCDLYISDPAHDRILRFDACVGTPEELPYLRGPGDAPGQLRKPRGLATAASPTGPRLYVADSGNGRVQVIDLRSRQVVGVWGGLVEPVDLASDSAGAVYVVDRGNDRVLKYSPSGEPIPAFWDAISGGPSRPQRPSRVAVVGSGEDLRVLVLDLGTTPPRVLIFDGSGDPSGPRGWVVEAPPDPVAMAADAGAIYLGGAGGTIAIYDPAGTLRSVLDDPDRPIAAMAVGCRGELLAGPGGLPVARYRPDGGFVAVGHFRAGPFETHAEALAWHRWRVLADPLDDGAHVQLSTFTDPGPPPDGGDQDPFPGPDWIAQPRDQLDVLILNRAVRDALAAGPPADPAGDVEGPLQASRFWIGGVLRGDGTTSPTLRQMRLDFRPETSLRHLPATYRAGPRRRLLLELFLALLDGERGRAEGLIAGLPGLFDPEAAPADWLPWLAGWLDFDLSGDWTEAETRRDIAGAFELFALRGTAEGLRRYLRLYAGVEARVEEPGADVSVFVLDDNVALGFNTRLAPAHEQGAVLGSTATLGQSHLLDPEEMGAPLFEDIAHRFCVQVYAAQVADPAVLDRVTRVLDREKPAHTDYHLCVIGPRMRVGFQARLGIDSIVAGPTLDLRLGDESALGVDTVLADRPRQSRRVGLGARVGGTL